LRDLHDLIPYDGIWLDMNEATGFCNGECPDGNINYSASVPTQEQIVKQKLNELMDIKNNTWYFEYTNQTLNSTYSLPFIAGKWNLDNMTMSLNATHPSGDATFTEYNAHSLFGHSEGKMTYEIFANETTTPSDLKDKRIFLLSRSTFSGSG
jgi:alpha-glucosidase (family GH31 glycosyl hydrolase)